MRDQQTISQQHPGNASAADPGMRQTVPSTGFRERRKRKAGDAGARDRVPSRTHHDREFGIGYGTSDGYADDEKYADSWAKAPFRIS